MQDLFKATELAELKSRIEALTADTQPKWGKMNAAQMLAHLNVQFEMLFDSKHAKPNAIMRFFLKLMVKPYAAGNKPYPKNSRTAPQFVIANTRDFEKEQNRLIAYMDKMHNLGIAHFVTIEYPSFGKLTEQEWRILFSKHIDYHLGQFGV